MKQFYSSLLKLRFTKSILLSAFFLCAFYTPKAQVYYATLLGSSEFPANNSTGTGKAVVTIDGNSMRVQVTFSGLVAQTSAGLPSGTTASHIHAPTAIPLSLTSTAGVATTTPTFTGFPLGVREGTYDHSFDMTLASSYNPAYITANGGTPASAFTALKAAISAGRSYLNIHSNAFPGGEIRGFLIACPTITVSIPDAFALLHGTLPNTVYPAYEPAASLTLQANVSGGAGPYIYNWSNSSTSSTITVHPSVSTLYSVTVHDQNGCPGSSSKTVNVVDISGGKNGEKIIVCHNGHNTLTIAAPAVADHLGHGDMLGSCSEAGQSLTVRENSSEQLVEALSAKVLYNPSPNYFELQLGGKAGHNLQIKVYDLMGRLIETKALLYSNQTIRLGMSYHPGTYLVQITQGKQMRILRLIKTK
jgi:hypothetical protein